jgi:hypothetical protein
MQDGEWAAVILPTAAAARCLPAGSVAVLQCCADEPHSLFSAARAHSRLHQAAVLAASCIRFVLKAGQPAEKQERQTDSMLLYLSKYGQHVSSIDLPTGMGPVGGVRSSLVQLSHKVRRLERLTASHLSLQLQPGRGHRGVLRAEMPLQQLCLDRCDLVDGHEGLAAAWLLLPKLQHLSIKQCYDVSGGTIKPWVVVRSDAVYSLQQLTYLELADCTLQDVQGLRQLTALQDLTLVLANDCVIDGSVLSGSQHLSCLQLHSCGGKIVIHPAVLAGTAWQDCLAGRSCSTFLWAA